MFKDISMRLIQSKRVSPPLLASALLFVGLFSFFLSDAFRALDIFQTDKPFTVVLDAGHGGDDPGKVSASGVKEKEINLAITLKCRTILEQNGITVKLTREDDRSLEDPSATNKKASDLQNRKNFFLEENPDCVVSIHQNSFPDSSQHGAQVFYPSSHEESKKLASFIQKQTIHLTGEENRREIKPNSSYFLLRDNPIPTVIAEVCFLSNPSEAALITDENIQEKAAFAIAMGIMQYLHS